MASVVPIAANTLGVDIDTPLSGNVASCLNSNSRIFCGRYIPLSGQTCGSNVDCLTAAEAGYLTEYGVAVLVIQHGRTTVYTSDSDAETYGTNDAAAAVTYLSQIGAPAGLYVYVDVENGNSSVDENSHYATAWANYIAGHGSYYPALYSGSCMTVP